MSLYFFLSILFNYIFSLKYDFLEKDKPYFFSLKGDNIIKGFYIKYSDLKKKDNSFESDLYFLKTSKEIKVNCIIKEGEDKPDISFDKDIPTGIAELCKSSIELDNNYKLIPFPKKLGKEEKIYFIFFLDKVQLTKTKYSVEIISSPKPLEINEEPYQIIINSKNTDIYFLKQEPEKYNTLTTLSDYKISVYAYKKNKFIKMGNNGEKLFMFHLNNEMELENAYYYAIFNNEKETVESVKILYNERIQLFNVNLNETSKVEINKFNTTYAFIKIYNPEKKLLNIKFPKQQSLRILDEDFINMEKELDVTLYKYIPQGYIYLPNDYSLFLVNPKLMNQQNLIIEVADLSNVPEEIEMNYFFYFKISKGNYYSFKVKNKNNNIIIKLICRNEGIIEVNYKNYSLSYQNQILKIDNDGNENLTIKAVDNDFILSIKSEISDKYIQYAESNEIYNVQTENDSNNSAFVALKIDYKNYDYAKFTFKDKDWKRKYKTSIDFGFLDKDEFSTNEIINDTDNDVVYDLSYYKKNENEKDLIKLYYIDNITKTSAISIQTNYYKEFFFEPNKFYRIGQYKLMGKFVNSVRMFFLTNGLSIFTLNCLTERGNIFINNSYDFILSNETDCYAELDMNGYVYIQPMINEDDTYYYDDNNIKKTLSLKVVFNKIRLSFEYNFTNSSNFNYTFIITKKENEKYFKNKVDIFDYFYFNKIDYDNEQFEIYFFSFDNMTKSKSNNIVTIELKRDDPKFDLYDKKQKYIYTIMLKIPL